MKTCLLIGHQEVREGVRERLAELIERHIAEYGVTSFTVGRQGEFDYLAASVIKNAKLHHPEVKLHLLLPCHPLFHPAEIPHGFDGVVCPPKTEQCVCEDHDHAVRYVTDNSDHLIAYAPYPEDQESLTGYAKLREERGLLRVSVL